MIPLPVLSFPAGEDDAGEGERIMLGGVILERRGDRWTVIEKPCTTGRLRDWYSLGGTRWVCQGHADGKPSHRALIGPPDEFPGEVLRWWLYGNDRTACVIGPARLASPPEDSWEPEPTDVLSPRVVREAVR